MSVSRLPSGRWRAQVHDPRAGHNVSVSRVLGGPGTFRTKAEAKAAREQARGMLCDTRREQVTVAQWRERWITDPLFAAPKESTNIHRAERTKAFTQRYGALALGDIGDFVVTQWLTGATRNSTIPALRKMFNDAGSAKGGRLVANNPFAGLGVSRGRGNRDKQPPSEEQVWSMIAHARTLASPAFAGWLQVAAFTGIRPGELDALRWTAIDFERDRIEIREQYNAATRTFTPPKNGQTRQTSLSEHARTAFVGLPRDGEFCFPSLRGTHFTPSSRAYHWKAVRAAAGLSQSLYLCTRHFAGWYMVNVLGLDSEDVAFALGHTDGGDLVRKLYGHRDRDMALDRVTAAHRSAGAVKPLRVVRKDTA